MYCCRTNGCTSSTLMHSKCPVSGVCWNGVCARRLFVIPNSSLLQTVKWPFPFLVSAALRRCALNLCVAGFAVCAWLVGLLLCTFGFRASTILLTDPVEWSSEQLQNGQSVEATEGVEPQEIQTSEGRKARQTQAQTCDSRNSG